MELLRQLAWPTGLPHCQSHQKHWALPRSREPLFLAPLWKSAIFWNVSTSDGVHWNGFVVDWVLLPKFQGLFVPGKARNSLFKSRPLFFSVIALRVYFRRPRPPSSLAGFCSTPPDGKCYLCLYTRVMRTFRFGPIRFLTPFLTLIFSEMFGPACILPIFPSL